MKLTMRLIRSRAMLRNWYASLHEAFQRVIRVLAQLTKRKWIQQVSQIISVPIDRRWDYWRLPWFYLCHNFNERQIKMKGNIWTKIIRFRMPHTTICALCVRDIPMVFDDSLLLWSLCALWKYVVWRIVINNNATLEEEYILSSMSLKLCRYILWQPWCSRRNQQQARIRWLEDGTSRKSSQLTYRVCNVDFWTVWRIWKLPQILKM